MVDYIYAACRGIAEISDLSELRKLKKGDKMGIDVSLDLYPSFTLRDIKDHQMDQIAKASARGRIGVFAMGGEFMDEQKLMSTRDGRKIDPVLEARLKRVFDAIKIEGRVIEYKDRELPPEITEYIEHFAMKTFRADQTVKSFSVKLEVDKTSQKGLYKLLTLEDPGMDSVTGSKILAAHFGLRDTLGLRFSGKKLKESREEQDEDLDFISGSVDIFRTEEISEEGLKYLKIGGYVHDRGDMVE